MIAICVTACSVAGAATAGAGLTSKTIAALKIKKRQPHAAKAVAMIAVIAGAAVAATGGTIIASTTLAATMVMTMTKTGTNFTPQL